MSSVALDPELKQALQRAAQIARDAGPVQAGVDGVRRHAELCRRYWNEGGPEVRMTEMSIPGPQRDVPVVIYRPAAAGPEPLPVFVFLHGGGFKIGSQWSNDRQMREIVAAWGGVVVSADYLHVPEHVFPTAVEETAAVLQWLNANGASLSIDGNQLACGGNSAGAAVAFGAAVELGGVPWLRAGVGIVGAYSGDTSRPSMQTYGQIGLFPEISAVPAIFDGYLPDVMNRCDPRADVLAAAPSLFPRTFLAAAEFDVFRDASVEFARHLTTADRLHSLKVYPGMSHLFFGFSREVTAARECIGDIAQFLQLQLSVARADA